MLERSMLLNIQIYIYITRLKFGLALMKKQEQSDKGPPVLNLKKAYRGMKLCKNVEKKRTIYQPAVKATKHLKRCLTKG